MYVLHITLYDQFGETISGFWIEETEDKIFKRFKEHILTGKEDVFTGRATKSPDGSGYMVRMSDVHELKTNPWAKDVKGEVPSDRTE